MVSINESKFGYKLVGTSPNSGLTEFECSVEDFITENQNGFTITMDEMFEEIINAKENETIHAISDKILVRKVSIEEKNNENR